MADGNVKGMGGRTFGFLSGIAAVSTAAAAIVAVLAQFGLIASRDTPKTVVVAATPGSLPSIAAPIAAAPPLQPSVANVNSAPPHRVRQQARPLPAQATARSPAENDTSLTTPSLVGAKNFAMVDRSQLGTIAGAWRDRRIGACHLIAQTGSKLKVTNYDPATGEVMGRGEGTIDGDHVEIDYPHARRPVTLDFHISPNGQILFGKIVRLDGTNRAMWKYLGPTCPKPG